MSIRLKGITWDHVRGFGPMAATAQQFQRMHHDVEICWEKRSLQLFADLPIEELARNFDLLVIDYPAVGSAAASGCLLALDEQLPGSFLDDQLTNSVGSSCRSYYYEGHQWALATDAAGPTASWRPDVIEKMHLDLPQTWGDLLELARAGVVAVPAVPCDALMNFYMLCCALGQEPFSSPSRLIDEDIGVSALNVLHELVLLCAPECLARNPIATYEAMVKADDIAYCPFAFCYSNYSRPGFAQALLEYGGLVHYEGAPLRSALGGAGLAVSSFSEQREMALEYALFVGSNDCQRGIYFESGGQPGYRGAWEDASVNAASNNFFRNVLGTIDQCWMRPRYDGYVGFQEHGGNLVHQFLRKGDARSTLAEMEMAYRHGGE